MKRCFFLSKFWLFNVKFGPFFPQILWGPRQLPKWPNGWAGSDHISTCHSKNAILTYSSLSVVLVTKQSVLNLHKIFMLASCAFSRSSIRNVLELNYELKKVAKSDVKSTTFVRYVKSDVNHVNLSSTMTSFLGMSEWIKETKDMTVRSRTTSGFRSISIVTIICYPDMFVVTAS